MSFNDIPCSSLPSRSQIGIGKLSFDPGLDFAPPVSDVSSNAKAIGSFAAVSPLVERGDRYAEIFC
jgi:hypothetical protein